VLIVEDDQELHELYGFMLEGQDWEQWRAHDGREALTCLASQSPDLILLDIIMDDIMGDEFYQRLRAESRWATIPVIVLSVLPVDRLEKMTDGDAKACFLRKPFRRRQLLEAIELMLQPGMDSQEETS
jgi:DNA-binding response OmpR family regulator